MGRFSKLWRAVLYFARENRLERIAAAAGGGAGPVTSDQWRVLIDTPGSGGIEIRELEFRAEADGADQCTGGVASASSQAGASWAPAKAFNDGADGFPWTPSPATAGQWIAYTTPAPITVNEILMHNSQQSTGPLAFSIQYHDGEDWVTHWSETGVVWTGSLQTKIFTKPA